jgi:hypothetical protein
MAATLIIGGFSGESLPSLPIEYCATDVTGPGAWRGAASAG